jgi:hypothetical protein
MPPPTPWCCLEATMVRRFIYNNEKKKDKKAQMKKRDKNTKKYSEIQQ